MNRWILFAFWLTGFISGLLDENATVVSWILTIIAIVMFVLLGEVKDE